MIHKGSSIHIRFWAFAATLACAGGAALYGARPSSASITPATAPKKTEVFGPSLEFDSDLNKHQPGFAPSGLDLVLTDQSARVSPQFHVPAGMSDAVRFWLKVYTQYSSQQIVVFDDRHLSVVYDVLDFRDLAKTARNRVVYEVTVQHRVKKAVAGFRTALASLARHPKPKHPNEFEKKILAAVQALPHKHSFAQLAHNVHTQTGQRDFIISGLQTADNYLPKMENIFRQVGVPPELTRLSMLESSFNVEAMSYVGAAGIWQFMPRSGKEYLYIDKHAGVDERISPLKATVAAAKLLQRNKKVLGTWPLALTSYNHGFAGLRHLTAAQKDLSQPGHVFDACRNKPLGWAGRNYYAEFLAILHAVAYKDLFYGEMPPLDAHPIAFHRLLRARSAAEVAMQEGLSWDRFKRYNPDVRTLQSQLRAGFWVAVPSRTTTQAAADLHALPENWLRSVRAIRGVSRGQSGPKTNTMPGELKRSMDHAVAREDSSSN